MVDDSGDFGDFGALYWENAQIILVIFCILLFDMASVVSLTIWDNLGIVTAKRRWGRKFTDCTWFRLWLGLGDRFSWNLMEYLGFLSLFLGWRRYLRYLRFSRYPIDWIFFWEFQINCYDPFSWSQCFTKQQYWFLLKKYLKFRIL